MRQFFKLFLCGALLLGTLNCGRNSVKPDVKEPDTDGPSSPEIVLPECLHIIQQDSEVNITVLTGDDGVLLVDTGYPERSAILREAIGAVTDKPVLRIINTHHHLDHAGGNAVLEQGGLIIANARNVQEVEVQSPGLQIQTVEDSLTLDFNGQRIECLDKSISHTVSDMLVYLADLNVLCTGDIYISTSFPSVDYRNGAKVQLLFETYEYIQSHYPEDVILIPGHGKVTTLQAFRNYVDQVEIMVQKIVDEMHEGRELYEMESDVDAILGPWLSWGAIVPKSYWLRSVYFSYYHSSQESE